MNGDSVRLLVDELFDPWSTRLVDWLFYAGVAIGLGKVVQAVSSLVPGIYTYLYPKPNLRALTLTERYGRWAGATSSMGVAFAKELAQCGFDVVLISRSYDNLIDLVSEIQSQYSVQAYGIHADFFLGQQVFSDIEEALLTDILDVGILVNVNPIKYDHPQYFSQVPRLWQLVNVNIAATTIITHIVLPSMLERGRGAIINVSSALGHNPPTPLLAAEAATMSYVTMLGRTLHEECYRKGIIVQTLTPLSLSKESNGHSSLVPSPQVYVHHALQTLTYRSHCCGYWPHAIMNYFHQLIPTSLWVWLTGHHNRASRQRHLTTGIRQPEVGLFARKPRRSSVAVAAIPDSSLSLSNPVGLSSPTSSSSSTSSSRPRRTVSMHEHKRPTFQRHYSRVTVMPSLVRDSSAS